GEFEISVEENSTLVFSFIGYKTKEVSVKEEMDLTIIMESGSTELSEVVAIGYETEKDINLTNSISKVKMDDLDDRPISSVSMALSGTMAGVRAQQTTGRPGSSLSIKVRGTGSITGGTGPLYVVDGMPIEGGLGNLNINDIESIQVLKDASSASIYGSRGANGVVIITTKKGKKGGPVINLDVKSGIQQVLDNYHVMNRDQWIDFALDERTNTWLYNGGDPNTPE